MLYVPTELGGDEVAVRTVCGRILVHAADDALLAQFILDAQLFDDFVDLQQYGTVERIVVERIKRL